MRPTLYALTEDKTPVPVDETDYVMPSVSDRRVALTELEGLLVSTVFLAVDQASDGPPVLFETMVFDDTFNSLDSERTCTWDEAVEAHERMCAQIRENIHTAG